MKKEVSFNQEVAIKEVTPIAVLTNNKLERVWFLENELNEMLDSAYDIVDQIEADEASDLDSDDNSYDDEKKRGKANGIKDCASWHSRSWRRTGWSHRLGQSTVLVGESQCEL